MKTTIALLLAAIPTMAWASGEINLQGTKFRSDTIAHYYIAPGATHTHYQLSSGTRNIHVYALAIDKADSVFPYNERVKPRVEIGCDQCLNAETVSSMAKRHTTASRQFIGGINADFFIMAAFADQHEFKREILGYPNMSCVIDRKIAAPDKIDQVSRENALMWGPDGMWIDATDLQYKILNLDGSQQIKAEAINYPRRDGEIMLYNSYMGPSTRTKAGGKEICLKLAEGQSWKVNSSVKFVVDGEWNSDGNMAIPEDGLVISCGPSYAPTWVNDLKKGDEIKIKIVLSLPAFDNIKPDIENVVGGDVRILNQGTVTRSAIRWINTPSAQYPRSLCGYSQDRNKLVFVAVDGGSTISSGVNYYEAADLMAALGCYDALDLDGGGSTAMWMAHTGIANRLRDGSERAVGNGLFVTMDAPADKTVASIRFSALSKTLPSFGSFVPTVYGYNQYGQLVDTDVKGFTLSAPAENAKIEEGTVYADVSGSFALVATKDGMTASMPVMINDSYAAAPVCENLIVDGSKEFFMPLQASVDGAPMDVAAKAYDWTSSNPAVASVDATTGAVKGIANGTAEITGVRGDKTVKFNALVQIANAQYMPLDTVTDASTWKLSRSGLGTNYVFEPKGDGGFNIEFDISNPRTPKWTMTKKMTVFGRPTGLRMVVDTKGCSIKTFGAAFKPATAMQPVNLTCDSLAADGVVFLDFKDMMDRDDVTAWPVEFLNLYLVPAAGANDTKHCALDFKSVDFVYDSFESSVDRIAVDRAADRLVFYAEGLTLHVLNATAPVELYTMDGRMVARGAGASLEAPAQGFYILRSGSHAAKVQLK